MVKTEKHSISREEIIKGIKAFRTFKKINKNSPIFKSKEITEEQVAIYLLWNLKCIKNHIKQ